MKVKVSFCGGFVLFPQKTKYINNINYIISPKDMSADNTRPPFVARTITKFNFFFKDAGEAAEGDSAACNVRY